MAKHGGKREGSGRKPWTQKQGELKEAQGAITKNASKAAKALIEALDAVYSVPRIVGRDEDGHPEYEYVSVPDHKIRVKAAEILLKKRIPDVERIEHSGVDGNPIQSEVIERVNRTGEFMKLLDLETRKKVINAAKKAIEKREATANKQLQ